MSTDPFTRRNFVKTSIAVAGSAALLPAQSPNDTVRVAFIGVGNRGSYLLQQMLKTGEIETIALKEREGNESRAKCLREEEIARREA